MKKSISFIAITILFFGLLGYGIVQRFVEQNKPSEQTSRIQVVASFYPLAHIAQQIGKDRVEVLNLTPAGSEPHDFDPSPRDVALLQNATMFIYNGAGLDSWAERLIPELEKKGVRVVKATYGLSLIDNDPHVWLDPVLFQEEVKTIAAAFSDADSAHADFYNENAKEYIQELTILDADFKAGLTQCKRHDIVTSHAAFAYLAQRYGLHMISLAGLTPEEEPSPARLAEVSKFVQEHGVAYIFFETLVSPKLAETIATETGAKTISFNPLEGLSDEEIAQGKTYISVQRENLQALRTALDCL